MAKRRQAEIVREFGPFPGAGAVHGVTFDGERVWFATGDDLRAFDPASGAETRRLARRGDAGTAFDGRHLFQLAGDRIDQIEPRTGEIVHSIPAPGEGGRSGLTWAAGSIRWIVPSRYRAIHSEPSAQVSPERPPSPGAGIERTISPVRGSI